MDKIYLIAQPNSGKTTLFNQLACENCYVANWPGKTVETFKARIVHHGKEIEIVDLPGINSFRTLSKEEELTKEVIFGKDGVAVVLVNGESLYRSFYFAVQVLELRENAILAINKLDYLERKGIHVNADILSKKLGTEVILLSALRRIGINQLLDRSIDHLENRSKKRLEIDYGVIETFIEKAKKITGDRALALRAIEGDEFVLSSLPAEKKAEIEKIVAEISKNYGNPEEIIAMRRYRFVEEVLSSAVKEVKVAEKPFGRTIDRVFFSKFGALLSLLILFFALFVSFSVNTGFPLNLILHSIGYEELAEIVETYSLVELISTAFDRISQFLGENIPESIFKDLLIGGIIPGIGAVASFFPLIIILNYVMSLIEDSGVMARIAVSMDRFFAVFGLTGKSVFPFSISLACNVPGIATTRILETDSERIRVALASPFVICQARLLVIVLFVTTLLISPILQSLTIIAVYVLSVFLFILTTMAYGRVVKKEPSELLIELPPYHFPSLRVSWWITWARSKAFIVKVGKLLLTFSVVMWTLDYLGLTKLTGAIIAKAFVPFGFESPEFGFAILVGFLAKELIISALAVSFETSNPSEILSQLALTPEQAIAMVIFIAFYTPCVATLSAIYAEIKNRRLLLFSVSFQMLVAYFVALISYLVLSLLL